MRERRNAEGTEEEHRVLRKESEFLVGAGDFGEEGAEFGGVFFAGAGFDAGGDIHGVGVDGHDGFTDIFRGEAAGKKDWEFFGG